MNSINASEILEISNYKWSGTKDIKKLGGIG